MSKRIHINVSGLGATCVLLLAHAVLAADAKPKPAPQQAPAKKTAAAQPDSTMTIKAGTEGKNFNSITVEGEDRVRVQFDRPELVLDVDPSKAPGLDFQSVWTALGAESFDFVDPLLARSASDRSPYAPCPWFDSFRDGPVARFRPAVTDVARWSLEVADSRGKTVARFQGDGKPPKEIAWDGATIDGTPARADLTYSYVLNAMDKAGNKRSFVGEGFQLPPHTSSTKEGVSMSFSVPAESAQDRVPEATVLEAATRLNHESDPATPVRIEVTAPTFNMAKSIADEVVASLRPHLYGEPSRITVATNVDAGGAERASVTIRTVR
jgi:hypothetical protein